MANIIGLVLSFSLLSQLFRLGTPFSGRRFIYRLATMLSLSQITLATCLSTWLAWVVTFANSHYCFRTPTKSSALGLGHSLIHIYHRFLFLFHRKCLALSHANTSALEFGEKIPVEFRGDTTKYQQLTGFFRLACFWNCEQIYN